MKESKVTTTPRKCKYSCGHVSRQHICCIDCVKLGIIIDTDNCNWCYVLGNETSYKTCQIDDDEIRQFRVFIGLVEGGDDK